MKNKTIMYIKIYKAISRMINKNNICDKPNEEELDLIQYTVNTIESNLEYYGIDKYNYSKEGGTPTEALEYYIETLSKKYLDLENIWDTKYWKYNYYIPTNPKTRIKIEEIMYNIEEKDEVKRFLNWWSNVQDCFIIKYFDYKIITKDQISQTIQNSECEDIRISTQDLGYNFYNPIITWEDHSDIPTLFIMDWVCPRSTIVREDWIQEPSDIEELIKEFGTPTLEKYINKKYGDYGKDVCMALKHEVNEFYNIYKDDIIEEDDELWSKSERLMLQDAIWGHAPLFSSTQIARLVEKIYNKELKL